MKFIVSKLVVSATALRMEPTTSVELMESGLTSQVTPTDESQIQTASPPTTQLSQVDVESQTSGFQIDPNAFYYVKPSFFKRGKIYGNRWDDPFPWSLFCCQCAVFNPRSWFEEYYAQNVDVPTEEDTNFLKDRIVGKQGVEMRNRLADHNGGRNLKTLKFKSCLKTSKSLFKSPF